MLYSLTKASKSYGGNTVWQDVTFEIKDREKIALVGRNGSGKTTFLRCLSHEENFDRAVESLARGTTVGYLGQKPLSIDERTVKEELMSVYEPLFAMAEKLVKLEEAMRHSASHDLLRDYAETREKFERDGGYQWETEMKTVFTRFGFLTDDLDRLVGSFSGGQKTRIAFVKLLLSKPQILLLDEPTNHLDTAAIEWLEGYIRNYPKAVVLVCHDRMFIDHTADIVYELSYGQMRRYPGNYSAYVNQKKKDAGRQAAAYARQQKDIERLQALIEKFRYKKNKAAFAQAKIRYLERMTKIEAPRGDEKTFKARFAPLVKGGETVLSAEDLSIGYDRVLAKVTLCLRRGDRIGVLGPNGCGKSTLVKTLTGSVEPLGGHYLYGHQISIGYFDQQLAQFSSGKTVLEELWDENPDLDQTAVRSVLGRFLFTSEEAFKDVDVLSGGEKVRLSLAKLLLRHDNFLILDEPTNHLDIPGKEALEEALKDYEGTVLFVSHDRYFINALATGLLVMEEGRAEYIAKTYREYIEDRIGAKSLSSRSDAPLKERARASRRGISAETEKRRLKALEELITAKEEEMAEKRALYEQKEYYDDYRKYNELTAEIEALENELADLYQNWENAAGSINE